MAFRPFLLAAAVLPSVVACGGDDGDGGNVTPMGAHYHYVANKVLVPTTNAQAREYGLDLNGDGTPDNQLGMVLSTLGSMGFDIQITIDEAVAIGDIILLADFQTEDFSNTAAAGVQVLLGATPTPMPCNTDETFDMTTRTGCGRHLTGTGMFTVAANSPTNAALGGRIVNGTFTGGPGDLSLQIALGGTSAIQLDLIGARAKGSSISETGIGTATSGGIVFAGAITKEDIDTKVLPAIHAQLVPIIEGDCTDPTSPPTCGCADNSTGKTLLGLFDTKLASGAEGKDCAVSVDEIATNSLIVSLLSPDVEINGKQALSLGIKATAVKAEFTVAGQQ